MTTIAQLEETETEIESADIREIEATAIVTEAEKTDAMTTGTGIVTESETATGIETDDVAMSL